MRMLNGNIGRKKRDMIVHGSSTEHRNTLSQYDYSPQPAWLQRTLLLFRHREAVVT